MEPKVFSFFLGTTCGQICNPPTFAQHHCCEILGQCRSELVNDLETTFPWFTLRFWLHSITTQPFPTNKPNSPAVFQVMPLILGKKHPTPARCSCDASVSPLRKLKPTSFCSLSGSPLPIAKRTHGLTTNRCPTSAFMLNSRLWFQSFDISPV